MMSVEFYINILDQIADFLIGSGMKQQVIIFRFFIQGIGKKVGQGIVVGEQLKKG